MPRDRIYLSGMSCVRARTQIEVIRDVMLSAAECARSCEACGDGWLTLREISELTAYGESSVSAQIRKLRNPEFGGYVVEKRRRRCGAEAPWEYRIAGQSEISLGAEVFERMREM